MVQTYKIVKEVDNVDRTHGFTMRGEEGSYGTRATQEGFKHHWKEVQTGGEKELLQSVSGGQLEWSVCREKLAKNIAEFKWRLRAENRHSFKYQNQNPKKN